MIATFIAFIVALSCISVAFRQFRRSAADDADRVARALGAAGSRDRQLLTRVLTESGPAADVARTVLRAPSREHAVAELNEELRIQERGVRVGSEVPLAAARIALASGTLLAIIEFARTLPGGGPTLWPLAAFGGGLFAAGAALALGRAARQRWKERCEAWNRLARALTSRFEPEL